MAVSGAGGWIPSRYATIRDRRLLFGTIAQNKPRDVVYLDMKEAATALVANPDRLVEFDTRGDNAVTLRRLLEGTGLIDAGAAGALHTIAAAPVGKTVLRCDETGWIKGSTANYESSGPWEIVAKTGNGDALARHITARRVTAKIPATAPVVLVE